MKNYKGAAKSWEPATQLAIALLLILIAQLLLTLITPSTEEMTLSVWVGMQILNSTLIFFTIPLIILYLRGERTAESWGFFPRLPAGVWLASAFMLILMLPPGDWLTQQMAGLESVPDWWKNMREARMSADERLQGTLNSRGYLLWLGFVMLVVVPPIAEEVFFRGTVQRLLRKMISPWLAGLVTAILFAVMHGNIDQLPGLFVLGLALGFIYEKTGKIGPGILAHAVYNGTVWAAEVGGIMKEPTRWNEWVPVVFPAAALGCAWIISKGMQRQNQKS